MKGPQGRTGVFRSPLLLAAALLVFPGAGHTAPLGGPLQVQNQFPLFIGINQPFLAPAFTQDLLSVGLSHSSVYVIEGSAQWTVNLDLELTELAIRAKKDIAHWFEVGVDVPVLRPTAGFMDNVLDSYHSAFGFPDYGRSARPPNEFLYAVRRNGTPVVLGENDKIGFGDVRLTFKRPLRNGNPAVSIMADLELPTGDAEAGYGNESLDTGVALLTDIRLGETVMLYGNLGVVFPGDLKAYQTVSLRNFGYAGLAVEGAFWERFSLLGQIWVQGSPYPHTGISQVDTATVILAFGARYTAGADRFEFSLTEDPNTSGAPDFILNITYTRAF